VNKKKQKNLGLAQVSIHLGIDPMSAVFSISKLRQGFTGFAGAQRP